MRALYESIIRSNGVSMYSRLKDLLRNPTDESDAKELNMLWNKLGLSIKGYRWTIQSDFADLGYECWYWNSDRRVIASDTAAYGWDMMIHSNRLNDPKDVSELLNKIKSIKGVVIQDPKGNSAANIIRVKFPG